MIKKLLIIISIFLTSSCGFKVINYSDLGNFEISSISATGDNRINFNIKNKLLASSKKGGSLIEIELSSKKTREIKEKNIKNEITKYEVSISIITKFTDTLNNKTHQFKKSLSGDYSVAKKYSQTLNNEKKLLELLTNKITEEILNEIVIKVNAI